MHKSIIIISILCVVAVVLFTVLIGDYLTSTMPVKSVSVGVESGEVTVSNNNQTQSIHPGEQAVSKPDGTIAKTDSPVPPGPSVPIQPANTASNIILASLNLSVKNTEGVAIPSVTGTITQDNLHQEFVLENDGTFHIENLKPGSAEIQIHHPSFFQTALSKTIIQAGTNECQIVTAQKAKFSALVLNSNREPVIKASAAIAPASDLQKIKEADLSSRESNEEGKISFDPLVSGGYNLSVSAPPYLPYEGMVNARIKEETTIVILSEKSHVTVAVLSERSTPIGGAKVTIQSASKKQGIYLAQQTNDLSGTTVFKDIPAGSYKISAQHGWFTDGGQGNVNFAVKNSNHQVKLVLADRKYAISGKVYDSATKNPISGVRVFALLDAKEIYKQKPESEMQTKEDGSYILENLHGGTYVIGVDSPPNYIKKSIMDFDHNGEPAPTRVTLGNDPEVKNIDFPLLGAWIVSGKVLLHDGSPVEGADVSAAYIYVNTSGTTGNSSTGDPKDVVKSGSDGSYRYVGTDYAFSERCKVQMFARHKTYQVSPLVQVQPQPGKEITGIDLIYEEKIIVTGVVVDKQEKPIADANLLFWPLPVTNLSKNVHLQSKEDGSFQIALAPGSYSARIMKEKYKQVTLNDPLTLQSGKPTEPLKIIMEDGEQSFEGWVSEEDGTPIPNCQVFLMYIGHGSGNSAAIATTDDNGRFRLVPANVYDCKEFVIFVSTSEKYEGANLRTTEWSAKDIHLVLKKREAEYGSISGVVLDDSQQPVPNYQIRLIPSQMKIPSMFQMYNWRTVFHPDGNFLIEKILLSEGPFVIAAKTENTPPVFSAVIELHKDEIRENVVLILPQSFVARGQVLLQDGTPAAGAIVELTPKILEGMNFDHYSSDNFKNSQPQTVTDNQGFFVFPKIPVQGGELYAWKVKTNNKDPMISFEPGSTSSWTMSSNPEFDKRIIVAPGQPGEQRDLGKIILDVYKK